MFKPSMSRASVCVIAFSVQSALGAVIPARDALGSGSAAGYVTGLHSALFVATIVAGAGSVATMALMGRGSMARDRATVGVDTFATEIA